MTTIQDLFEKYTNITNINTQDMPYSAIIDDWLMSELSSAQMKPKLVLPRIAPRPMESVILPSTKRKVEERQDEIAIKRQRNTDAARRSRLKKMIKMETLEKRVQALESENHGLSTRVAVLESEKSGLESKDHSLEERIRALENQLAEAHKALTNINKQ